MKKIVYLLLVLPVLVLAQSTDQNYVKTLAYKQESTTNLSLTSPLPSVAQVTVSYMDGLGRPIQQIAVQQSASGQNIVTPITYDIYGRQVKDYLPIPINGTSMSFIDNTTVISDPTSYYTNTYGSTDGAFRHSEKKFESSPLNRVFEQAAPGGDWALGNGHTIKMDYQTNTAADEVKLFTAIATYDSGSLLYNVALNNSTPFYPEHTLYKSIVKDENWTSGKLNTTEEFKNQEGQVVLKRTFNLLHGQEEAHDTYYVYDQFGNLSYVIPPLAYDPTDAEILDQLCYHYKYDARNRLAEKKLPGKDWEFIVYDKLDRVVATGPVYAPFEDFIAQNKKGWLITKYDAFNRVVLTAWKDISGRADLQMMYNNAEVLSEIKMEDQSEVNAVVFNYTNVAYPTSGYHVLTVNYYDDYTYVNAPTSFNVTLDGTNDVHYNNSDKKPKGLPTGSWVRILQSSTKTNAEKSYTLYDKKSRPVRQYLTNYLGGYTYTDSKLDFIGKTLYTITNHRKDPSSIEYVTKEAFTYSDQDRLLTHTHQIISHGIPAQLLSNNEYDELGQLIRKSVGGSDLNGKLSLQKVDYSYNIRGWLKSINDVTNLNIDQTPDLFAFKINYNNLDFAVPGIQPLYNGNIAETQWKTDSDNIIRGYGYQYDALNRLLAANYHKDFIETHSYDETLTYDKNGNIGTLLRNGFTDSGFPGMTYPIDALTYSYKPNSNQLQAVYDSTLSNEGFKDANTTAEDFIYDDFGNLTVDKNKGITSILYNHLNLPTSIIFENTSVITYIYNAVGNKLVKKASSTSTTQSTLIADVAYLSGFHYDCNKLRFFPTGEGYIRVTDETNFNYVYNYTDHLGNIRLSYAKDPETNTLKILEQNHYYPFGLKHENYSSERHKFTKNETFISEETISLESASAASSSIAATKIVPGGSGLTVVYGEYQYKYNGKEFQDELSLNWYDYQARNYDPAIGRWMNVDPLAETSRRFSPYTYCLNNPVFFIDPDGMEAEASDFKPDKKGNLIVEKGDNAKKLKKEYGVTATNKNFDWKEGSKIILDNNVTRAIDRSEGGTVDEINSGKAEFDVKNDNYICDEGAQMANAGEEITPENATKYGQIPDPTKFDSSPGYTETKSLDGIKKGEGLISIAGVHTVSYYGTSNNGTVFVFTKNGRKASPTVVPLNQVLTDYNKTNQDVKYFKKD
jgi:RHS repeat-associated protein